MSIPGDKNTVLTLLLDLVCFDASINYLYDSASPNWCSSNFLFDMNTHEGDTRSVPTPKTQINPCFFHRIRIGNKVGERIFKFPGKPVSFFRAYL